MLLPREQSTGQELVLFLFSNDNFNKIDSVFPKMFINKDCNIQVKFKLIIKKYGMVGNTPESVLLLIFISVTYCIVFFVQLNLLYYQYLWWIYK